MNTTSTFSAEAEPYEAAVVADNTGAEAHSAGVEHTAEEARAADNILEDSILEDNTGGKQARS